MVYTVEKLKTNIIIRCIIAISLWGQAMAYGQDTKQHVPFMAYDWYPKYVTFLPKDKLDSVLVYANTDIVPVIYKVNKYNLHSNPQLDSIVSLINTIRGDKRITLEYVWIGGSASPEGPIWWNKKLGDYRSKALAEFLLENTELETKDLRIENLEEDWYSVARTLERIDFPQKDTIIHIIQTEPDLLKRKQRIRAIDKGESWTRLIRNIFPPFRNARMVIVCLAEEPPVSPLPPHGIRPTINTPAIPYKPSRPERPDTWFIAIKTNGLFATALTANIGAEIEIGRQWSFDFPIYYSPYDITPERKLRLLAIQPEVRWWTKEAGEGHFLGLHTHVAGFNIAINDNGRYQDPNHAAWGIGLSYGYQMALGRKERWAVEFNLGAGFAEYSYDAYRNWENGPRYHSGKGWHWGITRAGISFSYKWFKQRKR